MKWLKKKDNRVGGDEIANQLNLAERISRRVLHATNAIDVVNGAIKDLEQHLDIEWAALSLQDEASQQLTVKLITDVDSEAVNIPLSGTPVSWVIDNK